MKAALAVLILLGSAAAAWQPAPWTSNPKSGQDETKVNCVNGYRRWNGTHYRCVCHNSNWTGEACDIDTSLCDFCPDIPDDLHLPFRDPHCINGVMKWNGTGYNCICNWTWTGSACDQEEPWYNHDADENQGPFPSQKCFNGLQAWNGTAYACKCYNGWIGEACDRRCVNGRIDWEDKCICNNRSWYGPACDQPCVNGIVASNGTSNYCRCNMAEWTGPACDQWITRRKKVLSCVNGYVNGTGQCVCYGSVWTGQACDERRCVNGNLIWNATIGNYSCRCYNSNWEGPACDQLSIVSYPTTTRCVNGYRNWKQKCQCYSEWTGTACDMPRCVNGYLAWNENGTASCRCNDSNWEGPACDRRRWWYQASLPTTPPYLQCYNGYTAYRFGSRSCECYSGWTGVDCSIRVPGAPNNTRCVNGYPIFRNRCNCYDGWMGDSCDVRCVNGYLSYRNNTCECYDAYKSSACTECINPDAEYPTCEVLWYKTVLRALEKAGKWTLKKLSRVNWVYVVIILVVTFIVYKLLRRSLLKAMNERDAKQHRQGAPNIAPPAYNERNCANNFVNPNVETAPLIDLSTDSVQPTVHVTPTRREFAAYQRSLETVNVGW